MWPFYIRVTKQESRTKEGYSTSSFSFADVTNKNNLENNNNLIGVNKNIRSFVELLAFIEKIRGGCRITEIVKIDPSLNESKRWKLSVLFF